MDDEQPDPPEPVVNRYELTIVAEAEVVKAPVEQQPQVEE